MDMVKVNGKAENLYEYSRCGYLQKYLAYNVIWINLIFIGSLPYVFVNILHMYSEKKCACFVICFFFFEKLTFCMCKKCAYFVRSMPLIKVLFFIELTLFGIQILCVRFAFKEMNNKELQMHTYVILVVLVY